MEFPKDLLTTTKNLFTPEDMEDMEHFKYASEQELYNYHFSICMFLRNHYKLWSIETQYDDNGFPIHPDDLSFEYI